MLGNYKGLSLSIRRPKVTAIENPRLVKAILLTELVGNLKSNEECLEKDLRLQRTRRKIQVSRNYSKTNNECDDNIFLGSAMIRNMQWPVRILRNSFRERRQFCPTTLWTQKELRKIKEERREDRRCFKCGDPNHFISDCPKNSSGDQKAFVVGSWSDSGDDSKKEESVF
ncbi:zf-CCHC domain-containing protein [Tanacetum coccineum]